MSKKILGFSEGFHDAAATVIEEDQVLFAAHSERFSREKNDKFIGEELFHHIHDNYDVDEIAFYEKTFLKRLRQLKAGQWKHAFKKRQYAWKFKYSFHHHLSHAAAAFQCSPFRKATALVVDAIGEMDTISIWKCWYENDKAKYKKIDCIKYPLSLGLFYSAMTKRVGLKPMEEEYIMMGMAAYGKLRIPVQTAIMKLLNQNLHRGVGTFLKNVSDEDIACNAQEITEKVLTKLLDKIDGPVVFGGGVAHNVVANAKIFADREHYIFPNPGDAGSSLGAAALVTKRKIDTNHWFTGYDVGQISASGVKEIVDYLEKYSIVGVCAQKAEFGPRALGNRSLLADPRDPNIKDKVNEIKLRQKFRPFAPSILKEHAEDYFLINDNQDYDFMQYTAPCHRRSEVPSICHFDGSARVHTVDLQTRNTSPLRKILEAWKAKTGCSLLLNTSLNIKGQPMVNNIDHAKDFENTYNVKVFTP